MPGHDGIMPYQEADQIDAKKGKCEKDNHDPSIFPVDPGFQIVTEEKDGQQEKQRMKRKRTGKIQTQTSQKGACHPASWTGNAKNIAEGTTGLPGKKIVDKANQT